MLVLLVRHLIFTDVCKLQSIVDLDCDFSLVINAAHVHYNFQSEKRDYELSISCQFCWWDIYLSPTAVEVGKLKIANLNFF